MVHSEVGRKTVTLIHSQRRGSEVTYVLAEVKLILLGLLLGLRHATLHLCLLLNAFDEVRKCA